MDRIGILANVHQHRGVKYTTVDTSTLKGLKRAERLKANGWTIGSVGIYTIGFYKKVEHKKKGAK